MKTFEIFENKIHNFKTSLQKSVVTNIEPLE